jgi:acyl-CoA synthetase (NDP forming)
VEERQSDIARHGGMRLVGPNCMGVLSTDPKIRLNATFSPVSPPAGNVSMATQSGALGLAMIDHARSLQLGIADFASIARGHLHEITRQLVERDVVRQEPRRSRAEPSQHPR